MGENNMKIMIVDDNSDNLEMLEIILRSQNNNVDTAINGKIALEKLKANKYDLIISDILMPVMDGFQLCRECRKDEELRKICFIFYTATYIDSKDEEFSKSVGAQQFIRKPQDPEILLQIINDAYNKFSEAPIIHEEQKEEEILKLYNERLVAKLEKKNIDLEKEIAAHKKTVEELIIAKDKAEEMNRLKSNFLANMSHELRTPMVGILGFSELIQTEKNLDTTKELGMLISKSSSRLMNTLNSIINLSIVESERITVHEQIINIVELITRIIEIYENEAKSKGLTIRMEAENKAIFIKTDEKIITDILTNLLSNAIKFTDRGDITISLRYDTNNDKNFVSIEVKDTGIGIEESQFNVIFDEFRQASEGLSRSFEGTGLGLTLCKKYIELLGGTILVKSKLNMGSTFFVKLPSSKINVSGINVNKKVPIDLDKQIEQLNYIQGKILYVEDDDTNRKLMKIYLKDKFELDFALNTKEALQKVKENNYILILMDINLGHGDNGIVAVKEIRKIEKFKKLPIIAVTAYAMFGDKEEFIHVGCSDYLPKPYNKDTLLSTIAKNLN